MSSRPRRTAAAAEQSDQQSAVGVKSPRRNTSAGVKKKRITKDEKICQLKSDLKISKEENARLKKEIQRLKQQQQGNPAGGGASSTTNGANPQEQQQQQQQKPAVMEEQQKKFREAMRALKKVTVSQEMCIRTLRTKAKERRKDIKQRDAKIKSLQQHVKSLETSGRMIQKSHGDQDTLQAKVQDLQLAYDDMLQRKNNVEELLEEKDSQLEALQKQRNSLLAPLNSNGNNNNRRGETSDADQSIGSGSYSQQSISTAGDFDVARLKKELAQKSEKILKLQMDLEMAKDEIYDLKQKKESAAFTNNRNDPFATSFYPAFSTATLSMHRGGGGQTTTSGEDDWTEIDETDNEESEFGEMQQFGGGNEFGESFFKEEETESVVFRKEETESVDFW